MRKENRKKILAFIRKYQDKKDVCPSLEEIKNKFGLASVSTAHYHVKKLEEAGLLIKKGNKPRRILNANIRIYLQEMRKRI